MSSLFGAIDTAVSGLTAQSTAFGNIAEDVANSQTVGFKRVDTSFKDYLTTSTPTSNVPGAVVAQPVYVNNSQGTVTQTDNPLGLAIAGQGFFAVSQPIGETKGVTTFNTQQFYSRAGDFSMNASGYLVNSAGQFLNGWAVNPTTGVTNQNALVPIQINQSTYNPVATKNVTLAANLPATPAANTATTASPPVVADHRI
jgi:flagellar hook protein FlgE